MTARDPSARGQPVSLGPPGPPPGEHGRFGEFGGSFVPEALIPALRELEREFTTAWSSDEFRGELATLLASYAGRPTPVTECHRLSERLGVRVLLKREDLTHTGSHKINNVLGQALLTRRMGKRRVIAETGAGQHGVATATAAALFGLDCTVFMGAVDVQRQALNVWRMRLLGSEVIPVESGSATLKDAINDALRDWVATVETTHYCIGSVVGPHPYPWLVREFQRVVGDEAREQCREILGGDDPDYVVACVGGGSNAIGTFAGFIDTDAQLIGVEAAGLGLESGQHGASVTRGVPGVLHGARSLFLQDEDGQIREAHSISAGLDYPGVGPEHASLAASGRASYQAATDDEAIAGFQLLAVTEGIVPALEPAHAIGWLGREAGRTVPSGATVLVTLSGRGDKDAEQLAERLAGEGQA
jgi:tryptophan synthase beta chain